MFMLRNTTGAGRKLVPYSRGEWPYPQAGMKGKQLFGNDPTAFQTCELGLPCKVRNSIRIVRLSQILRLLDPFATQSNKSNAIMINLDVWLKVLPWLIRISCLHRMLNQLEYWKLKCEIKDLLFVAFQQKKNQSLTEPCIVQLSGLSISIDG